MPRSRPAKEADTPQSQAAAKPNRFAKGFDWPVTSVLIGYHVLALAAPFFFSWTGLIVFLVLSVITGWLGITLCYHRLLTHDSFQTYRPIRWLLAFFGTLASEGSPIDFRNLRLRELP